MAELDKLSIVVQASTSDAVTSIDKLIGTLGKLSNAFEIKGLDRFVSSLDSLSSAIGRINGDSLEHITDAIGRLKKSTKSLANLDDKAAKSGASVERLGKKLADIANIKDKKGISSLTESLREFLSSSSGEEMVASRNKVLNIAKSFGQVGTVINEDREAALRLIDLLNSSKINLPKEWTSEYGDSEYAKKLRGMVGISNTVASGGMDASEKAAQLGLGDFGGRDADAFKAIASAASIAREYIADTDDEIVSMSEALREGGERAREAAAAMDAFCKQLANAVGLTSEQLNGVGKGDGFLGEEFEQDNIVLEKFISGAERLLEQGNPFQNITDGLTELGNVDVSEKTLENIKGIRDAISRIGGKAGAQAGPAMRDIASGLQALNVNVPQIGEDLTGLSKGLRALGSGNVVTASQILPFMAEGLRELNSVKMTGSATQIAELAKAVSMFGYAKAEKAIVNLPVLATELNRLITTLSKAPAVSQSTVELVKALGNMNVHAKTLEPSTRRAGNALDLFHKKATRTKKSTFSLAAAIGKLYATYWALFRVVGMFGKSIDLASDLTETQNIVDHVFGDMKYQMEDFAKTAVETTGMSELTAKKIGSRFQSLGKNMGISNQAIRESSQFVHDATNQYVDLSDSVADMSINLTKLTGDMASFYNQDYESVAEDMEAIYTGMTRPLRKYGLDLTIATLKEFALANGLNADIKNMTQAEKTMLRYQYVMANTTAAQGDFERTINTWANQTKIARENLKRLQIILGQIGINTFKPLVQNFNVAMNDILHLAESTFNSLGTIFGWQIEISDVGIIDDMADGLEDVEDGFDGAGKEAKKFKNFLLGIDELNLLPDNNDKDKGSGAGSMLGATANGLQDSLVDMKKTEKGFDSIYDTLFKLGARIGEVQKEWMKGIDWDSIFDKAEGFGKGLASFLNGYLSDAETFYQRGRFIANGINTIAHAIYGFFHEFDGYQLGKDLGFSLNGIVGNLNWDTINAAGYELAHDITESVNGFFDNVNWTDLGKGIIEGFNVVVRFVSRFWNDIHWDIIGQSFADMINGMFVNWDYEETARMFHGKIKAILDFANNFLSSTDFDMIGEKIGKFLSDLHLEEFADDIAVLIRNLIKAAFDLLPGLVEEAPLETALLLAYGGLKFNKFGNSFSGNLAGAISNAFLPKLTAMMKTDLAKLQFDSTLLGSAKLVGTALGAAIVAAAAAYVGYNIGLEIGKKLNPDDEMWYTKDAWIQAIFGIKDWGNAIDEGIKTARTHLENGDKVLRSFQGTWFSDAQVELGVNEDTTWEDIKNALRVGNRHFTDDDFEYIKQGITEGGASAVEINDLINELKDAQNSYENGFKDWFESNESAWYAVNYGHQSRIDVYQQYLDDIAEQEKGFENYIRMNERVRMAIEHGAMSMEEARAMYEEMQKTPAASVYVRKPLEEMAQSVETYSDVMDVASEVVDRSANTMGNSIASFVLKQSGMFQSATRTIAEYEEGLDSTVIIFEYEIPREIEQAKSKFKSFGKTIGDIGRTSASAFSEAMGNMFKFDTLQDQFEREFNNNNVTDVFNNVLGSTSGGGNFQVVLQDMDRLNMRVLESKVGLEQLSAAFDNVSSKKDKTSSLTDGFDVVKGKVAELGQSIMPDAMSKMLSGIPDAFKKAWSDALNVMRLMWAEMAQWINANAKIEIPKTKIGKQEIGGGTVQLRIPKFDVGGSIPNDGSLFFANEKGPEVMANMGRSTGIMNTDQMETAIANGMAKALANGNQNVTVVLNGDAASFFTAMVKENNSSIMRTGVSPLRV